MENSMLNQHDDEIEMDIDSVNTETISELDRFVTNYKKSLSKKKRKAELAVLARVEGHHEHAEQEQETVREKAMSIFLAMVLRALGSDHGSYYDSDEDYIPTRVPLLRNQAEPVPYIVDPHQIVHNDSWNVRVNDKVSKG